MIPKGAGSYGWISFGDALEALLFPHAMLHPKIGVSSVSLGRIAHIRNVKGKVGSSSVAPNRFVDGKQTFVDIVKSKKSMAVKDASFGRGGSGWATQAMGDSHEELINSSTEILYPAVKNSLPQIIRKEFVLAIKENIVGEKSTEDFMGFKFKKTIRIDFNTNGERCVYWILIRSPTSSIGPKGGAFGKQVFKRKAQFATGGSSTWNKASLSRYSFGRGSDCSTDPAHHPPHARATHLPSSLPSVVQTHEGSKRVAMHQYGLRSSQEFSQLVLCSMGGQRRTETSDGSGEGSRTITVSSFGLPRTREPDGNVWCLF